MFHAILLESRKHGASRMCSVEVFVLCISALVNRRPPSLPAPPSRPPPATGGLLLGIFNEKRTIKMARPKAEFRGLIPHWPF